MSQKSISCFFACFTTWTKVGETLFRISLLKILRVLKNKNFWLLLNSNPKNLEKEGQSSSCFNKRSNVLNVLPSYHKRSKLPISSFHLKTSSLFSSSVPEKRANNNAKAK